MSADYLRKQATTCLSWARECFDLEAARRLRLLAEEFRAKADEIEASTRFASESPAPPRASTPQARSDDR